MSQIQDKFDRLPQEFDKLAIWQKIDLPKSTFPLRMLWRGAFFALGFAGWGVSTFIHLECMEPQIIRSLMISPGEAHSMLEPGDKQVNLTIPQQEGANIHSSQSDSHSHLDPERVTAPQLALAAEKETADQFYSQMNDIQPEHPSIQPAQLTAPQQKVEDEIRQISSPTTVLSFPHHEDNEAATIPFTPISPQRNANSLAIQFGTGTHLARLQSETAEDVAWRKTLEKPQLDYTVGLRYERRIRGDFLIAASANYDLYKEQIITSYLRDSLGQTDLVEYEIYNHYHVFSGQLQLGKRVSRGIFFWDIFGGAGINVRQVSEVDYFVGEGQLASESEIGLVYAHSTDLFYTAQSAVGRHIGKRGFLRAGVRLSHGLDLSGPDSPVRHTVTSAYPFLEAGLRF